MISVDSMRRKSLLRSHYGATLINRALGEARGEPGCVGSGCNAQAQVKKHAITDRYGVPGRGALYPAEGLIVGSTEKGDDFLGSS